MKSDITQRIAMKAIIMNDDRKVLILREAETYQDGTDKTIGKYGVPGGRLEPGEPFLDGLNREIGEESGLKVEVVAPVYVDEWRPVIRGTKNQIVGVFFLCRPITTDIKLSDEHDDYQWISLDEIEKFTLMDVEEAALRAAYAKKQGSKNEK